MARRSCGRTVLRIQAAIADRQPLSFSCPGIAPASSTIARRRDRVRSPRDGSSGRRRAVHGDPGRHHHHPGHPAHRFVARGGCGRCQHRDFRLPGDRRDPHTGERVDGGPVRGPQGVHRSNRGVHSRIRRMCGQRVAADARRDARRTGSRRRLDGARRSPPRVAVKCEGRPGPGIAWLTWPALAAPVLAPILGGAVATVGSWRWIFIVNIPSALSDSCCR